MNAEFIEEIVEHEHARYFDRLTGWETVVFQLEDEPESDRSTAAIAP